MVSLYNRCLLMWHNAKRSLWLGGQNGTTNTIFVDLHFDVSVVFASLVHGACHLGPMGNQARLARGFVV